MVREYMLGTAALLTRLGISARRLVGLRIRRKPLCVPWDQLDLRDPEKPKLLCSLEELTAEGADPRSGSRPASRLAPPSSGRPRSPSRPASRAALRRSAPLPPPDGCRASRAGGGRSGRPGSSPGAWEGRSSCRSDRKGTSNGSRPAVRSMMAPIATTRAPRAVASEAVSRVERPVVTTSSMITTRSPWRRVKPRRSPISSPLRSVKRKGTPSSAATSWPMMMPPRAGEEHRVGVERAQQLGEVAPHLAGPHRVLEQQGALHVGLRVEARGEQEMAAPQGAALLQHLRQDLLVTAHGSAPPGGCRTGRASCRGCCAACRSPAPSG